MRRGFARSAAACGEEPGPVHHLLASLLLSKSRLPFPCGRETDPEPGIPAARPTARTAASFFTAVVRWEREDRLLMPMPSRPTIPPDELLADWALASKGEIPFPIELLR